MAGTLFVVGTPIGNLADLSERAAVTLAAVDVIACEDTRRTGRLLQHIRVRGALLSFFQGNEATRVPEIVKILDDQRDVALVTDAGMPGVSDPGYRLVRACLDAGIPVDVVPGPSSVLAALVVSGIPADRFVFEGFLPRSGAPRRERLAALASERRTAVVFESPRRLERTLRDLLASGGDRPAAVARELTKLHQEVLRGSLSELVDRVADRGELKGEVVLVVGAAPGAPPASVAGRMEDALAIASAAVARGLRKREAAKEAAATTGVPAREVYRLLVG